MADNSAKVNTLIGGLEHKDTRLFSLLQTLSDDLYGLQRQINPPTAQSVALISGGGSSTVTTVTNFAASVFSNDIRLSWNPASTDTLLYEIRMGDVYDTATILLTTATLSADIDPVSRFILTNTTYTFWITTLDNLGNRSVPASISVSIPDIGSPVITPTILQNYVLLSWTIPTSTFVIDHYNVLRNGVQYGIIAGTFQAIFEVAAGTYAYSVQAVDIVGNLGTPSPTVTVVLGAPPDYATQGSITSTFTGTKSNCANDIDSTRLIAPVNATETWTQHFTGNSWIKIQDQINAGYPYFGEPSKSTATYTETFDFGSIFNNIIVALNYNTTVYVGSVAINFTIAVSTDNITFDSPVSGITRFATAARYVKVVVTFTPSPTDKSLIDFFNFTCNLNVHQETDSGTIAAISTDSGGTTVTFNKAFHFVNSIALAVKSTTEKKAVFDFTFTTVSPTTFKVLVFDAAGSRVSATVGWLAKGII